MSSLIDLQKVAQADVSNTGAYRSSRSLPKPALKAYRNSEAVYGTLLPANMPITKKIRQTTRNRKNKNFAIPAAAAAIPANPKKRGHQCDYKKNQGPTQHAFTS
jgi:hypothetical protein